MSLLKNVQLLRKHPGMLLGHEDVTFDTCAALLEGHHMASGSLHGFREFLILRLDGGANLTWSALVLHLTFPGGYHRPGDADEERLAVSKLLELASEFLAEATYGHGRDRILHEYATWQRAQSWYEPDLERFDSYPAPEVVGVDDVARSLGMGRTELFDSLRDLGLFPLRVGAEVVFRKAEVEALLEQRTANGLAAEPSPIEGE